VCDHGSTQNKLESYFVKNLF